MKALPAKNVPEAIAALAQTGKVSRRFAERAYERWRYEAPVRPCVHGPDSPLATDCECHGCMQRICFIVLDAMANRFPVKE